jgi:hypothetical protein
MDSTISVISCEAVRVFGGFKGFSHLELQCTGG